jgi:hypothetical protein
VLPNHGADLIDSPLADPGKLGLDRRLRFVLAVAPRAALARFVILAATAPADHLVPANRLAGKTYAALALARRILRRRSAERSSSFRPPQVPYFSGLLTA